MSKVSFGRHAIVGASAFLLACMAGDPAMSQPSLGYLKVRYEQACELARSAEAYLNQLDAASYARSVIDLVLDITESRPANMEWQPLADYETRLFAWQLARTKCLEYKGEYLEALTEQIILAALTEPPPETALVTPPPAVEQTTRPPARPPKPPVRTTRSPPSSYQTDSAAAAALIMNIIGGAIETYRPPRGPTVRPGGQRYQGAIP